MCVHLSLKALGLGEFLKECLLVGMCLTGGGGVGTEAGRGFALWNQMVVKRGYWDEVLHGNLK